ncbi:hypothetical protein [Geomonas sp.]|uniref:hypothetical protein n=1 Tax=Geomonas sp. TaxID=2651584 RepID=UPI002B49CA16|nr:hypothetical protein [Geomonas sp.]HJV36607.1 hypothetical protein [Geomonas sp.]
MKETRLTLPQLALIAGTRVVLGGGIGLLIADRLNDRERKMAGWALFVGGMISTIPLGRMVLSRRHAKGECREGKARAAR